MPLMSKEIILLMKNEKSLKREPAIFQKLGKIWSIWSQMKHRLNVISIVLEDLAIKDIFIFVPKTVICLDKTPVLTMSLLILKKHSSNAEQISKT